MRVILRERPEHEQENGYIIEAEIDCKRNGNLGFDIIRWRDMDFVYNGKIVDGKAIYVRATGTTINWYPNSEGEKFTG